MRNRQPSPRRFYRDPDRRMLGGVCAGMADYFGFQVGATRFIYFIGAMMFPILILAYVAACLLIPTRPKDIYEDVVVKDEEFWKSVRQSPKVTLSDVRHRFRELEVRLQRMERYVTSPRFNLDREFENLRD